MARRGKWGCLLRGYTVSTQEDGKVLEVGGGLKPLHTSHSKFYVMYILTTIKKKTWWASFRTLVLIKSTFIQNN